LTLLNYPKLNHLRATFEYTQKRAHQNKYQGKDNNWAQNQNKRSFSWALSIVLWIWLKLCFE